MVELHFVIPLTVVYVPNDHQTDGQSMTKPSWALDWFIFLPLTYMVVKYYIFYRYIYIYIILYGYIIWQTRRCGMLALSLPFSPVFAEMSLAFGANHLEASWSGPEYRLGTWIPLDPLT